MAFIITCDVAEPLHGAVPKLYVTVYVPGVDVARFIAPVAFIFKPAGDALNVPPVAPVVVSVVVPVPQKVPPLTVADGAGFGDAVPEPGRLVQPFIVCVTVYVPAVVTVMELPVAPLLHNIAAPFTRLPAVKVEVAQLSATVTVGVAGADGAVIVAFTPAGDVQPLAVTVRLLYAPAGTLFIVALPPLTVTLLNDPPV